MSKVYVGDFVTVGWSNGHGESVYRVVENLVGPASFVLFSEFDYGDDDDNEITDDDMNAVFADIVARRGVA